MTPGPRVSQESPLPMVYIRLRLFLMDLEPTWAHIVHVMLISKLPIFLKLIAKPLSPSHFHLWLFCGNFSSNYLNMDPRKKIIKGVLCILWVCKKPRLWIFFCKQCAKVQGSKIIFFIFGLASSNMQQIKKILMVLSSTELVIHLGKWAPNFPKIVAV